MDVDTLSVLRKELQPLTKFTCWLPVFDNEYVVDRIRLLSLLFDR